MQNSLINKFVREMGRIGEGTKRSGDAALEKWAAIRHVPKDDKKGTKK